MDTDLKEDINFNINFNLKTLICCKKQTSLIFLLLPLPGINPLKMLGVSHDALMFLIEQLYGAKNCHEYKFRYHQYYDAEFDEVRLCEVVVNTFFFLVKIFDKVLMITFAYIFLF